MRTRREIDPCTSRRGVRSYTTPRERHVCANTEPGPYAARERPMYVTTTGCARIRPHANAMCARTRNPVRTRRERDPCTPRRRPVLVYDPRERHVRTTSPPPPAGRAPPGSARRPHINHHHRTLDTYATPHTRHQTTPPRHPRERAIASPARRTRARVLVMNALIAPSGLVPLAAKRAVAPRRASRAVVAPKVRLSRASTASIARSRGRSRARADRASARRTRTSRGRARARDGCVGDDVGGDARASRAASASARARDRARAIGGGKDTGEISGWCLCAQTVRMD